jgi:hypothetical protein
MSEPNPEELLQQARMRGLSQEELAGYTSQVQRKIAEAAQPLQQTAPSWEWWHVVVPAGVVAMLLVMCLPLLKEMHPARVAITATDSIALPVLADDAALTEEMLILSELSDGVLDFEEEGTLFEELEELEFLDALLGEDLYQSSSRDVFMLVGSHRQQQVCLWQRCEVDSLLQRPPYAV